MSLPANHPDRSKRTEEVEAGFKCHDCGHEWFCVAFEGEPPPNHLTCLSCKGKGRRVR